VTEFGGDAEAMYREHILDHYKHPRNFGVLEGADIDHREDNPLCGDDIRMMLKLDGDGRVADVRFHGRGCAISQASASMLTERAKGLTLEAIKGLQRDDLLQMLGITVSPVRLKCAILSLVVLRDGVELYEKSHAPG